MKPKLFIDHETMTQQCIACLKGMKLSQDFIAAFNKDKILCFDKLTIRETNAFEQQLQMYIEKRFEVYAYLAIIENDIIGKDNIAFLVANGTYESTHEIEVEEIEDGFANYIIINKNNYKTEEGLLMYALDENDKIHIISKSGE